MYIPDEHDPDEITLAQKLVIQCLSADRAEAYSSWMEVGWCLYNVDPSEAMFNVWREFSAKSPKSTGTDWTKLLREWVRGFSRNTPGAKFTLKSLHFWARADSPAVYKTLVEEDHVRYVQTRVDDTHYHVAKLLLRMYKGKFCASIEMRKSEWYVYDERIQSWRHTNQGMELREKLSTEVVDLIVAARMRLKKQAWDEHCKQKGAGTGDMAPMPDEDFFKQWALTPDGQRFTTLMKVEKHLYTTEFKNCVMKEAQEIFSEQDFQNRLNMSTTLFGCRNGVLDLRSEVKDPVTGKVGLKVVFRPGRPDDYISQLAGRMYPELEPFDYTPYDSEAPALKALMAVLRQIFTDPEMLAYVIRLMASCLEGANREQCYYTLIGVGGNGKSKLVDLMRYTFGDYSSSLQATALTRKRPESGAANPDIISIKNKRFIYLAEPDDKEPLNTSRMKQFSGEDVVEARGLFEDQQRFRITGKLFMLCNRLPPVHSMDRGTWRRIRAVMFPSLFVDESAPELHQGKPNVFLRNNDLDNDLKKTEWRQAWLGLLVHVYETEYLKRGLEPIPASVLQESNKYRETFDQYGKFKAERLVDFRDVRAGLTEFGDEKSLLKDICSSYTTWQRQNEGTLPGKRLTKQELQARLEEDFGFAEGGSFRRVVVFYDDDQREGFVAERRPALTSA
jgi:P4 family phage/plasmid primase-like protien